jgi:hypothetical protein
VEDVVIANSNVQEVAGSDARRIVVIIFGSRGWYLER